MTRAAQIDREAPIRGEGVFARGATERLGTLVLYTEDLTHNRVNGSLRAVHPFLEN